MSRPARWYFRCRLRCRSRRGPHCRGTPPRSTTAWAIAASRSVARNRPGSSVPSSASLAVVSALTLVWAVACHGTPPATAGSPERSGAANCKVSRPVCDPRVSEDTALALVRRRCAGCHAEGGKADHPFLDADALSATRGDVALRLAGCEMPPDDTLLPTNERARLIGWGACVLPAAAR